MFMSPTRVATNGCEPTRSPFLFSSRVIGSEQQLWTIMIKPFKKESLLLPALQMLFQASTHTLPPAVKSELSCLGAFKKRLDELNSNKRYKRGKWTQQY